MGALTRKQKKMLIRIAAAAVLLCGEALAVAYTALRSPVLRAPFLQKSDHAPAVTRSCAALVSAQLFLYRTMHADRLLIGAVTDGTQVTIYYTASLLGKAMAMLTEPIAGVAIGFLARAKSFGRRQFLLASSGSVLLGLAAFLVMLPVAGCCRGRRAVFSGG